MRRFDVADHGDGLPGTPCDNGAVDKLQAIETYWSNQAPSFDDEPDHGLSDPHVRAAWARRLGEWVVPKAAKVADLGCGTGSLSVLLAECGAEVVGVDLSPAMAEQAQHKARLAGLAVDFRVGDASDPDLPAHGFDVVLSRHVVWNLADPEAALSRWVRLLNRRGRLVLIEGRWFDPSRASDEQDDLPWEDGVGASELMQWLEPMFARLDHYSLSEEAELWGKTVTDERYAVVAQSAVPHP